MAVSTRSFFVTLALLILALVSSSDAGHVKRFAGTATVDISHYSPTLSNGKASLRALL